MTQEKIDKIMNEFIEWFAKTRKPHISTKQVHKVLTENGITTPAGEKEMTQWLLKHKEEFIKRLHAKILEMEGSK